MRNFQKYFTAIFFLQFFYDACATDSPSHLMGPLMAFGPPSSQKNYPVSLLLSEHRDGSPIFTNVKIDTSFKTKEGGMVTFACEFKQEKPKVMESKGITLSVSQHFFDPNKPFSDLVKSFIEDFVDQKFPSLSQEPFLSKGEIALQKLMALPKPILNSLTLGSFSLNTGTQETLKRHEIIEERNKSFYQHLTENESINHEKSYQIGLGNKLTFSLKKQIPQETDSLSSFEPLPYKIPKISETVGTVFGVTLQEQINNTLKKSRMDMHS